MEIAQSLLPNSPFLRLENWQIDKISAQIILNVVSTQPLAYCPLCHHQELGSRKSEFGKQLFNSELRIPNGELERSD